ncbi:MAG: TIGR00268 family protein, partial [Clostridiales bacterium]|nr:TIGR00268 family protein [Clostridiales bacterium]
LSSRFVYGETITREKLAMVDRAEQLLLDLGFHQVRVRIHGGIARIEVEPGEFGKIMIEDVREEIYQKFQSYGFSYVTLDLRGYRTGSMNETLNQDH